MRIKSRQVTEFPKALDQMGSPYALNEFTPSARSLSDENAPDSSDHLKSRRMTSRLAKAVFVGDVGVGKTSIINRFCRDIFEPSYKPTIGVDYEMERFWVLNVPFNLQIWDTAGQERFKCIAASYYRGSSAVITVFDASNLESLSTCQRWMDEVVQANADMPLKFLVATKMDLVTENHRDRIFEMGKRMANLLQAEFWPVSSKSGENMEIFFRRIAVLAFETGLTNDVSESISKSHAAVHGYSNQPVIQNFRETRGPGSPSRAVKKCSSCKTS